MSEGSKLPRYSLLDSSYQDQSISETGNQIISDAGLGFGVGISWGLYKSFRNLPKNGFLTRLRCGLQASCVNAPRFGGKFATFLALMSGLEATMVHCRRKDDAWNGIMSCTATVALFKSSQGLRAASRSAIGWGAVFALMEGFMFVSRSGFLDNRAISVCNIVVPPPAEIMLNQYMISKFKQQMNGVYFGGRLLFGGLFVEEKSKAIRTHVESLIHKAQIDTPITKHYIMFMGF